MGNESIPDSAKDRTHLWVEVRRSTTVIWKVFDGSNRAHGRRTDIRCNPSPWDRMIELYCLTDDHVVCRWLCRGFGVPICVSIGI